MPALQSPLSDPDVGAQQQHHDLFSLSHIRRHRTRSPAATHRVQIKNRRRRYLELHPEYFDSFSLELADPLAYDLLIRRFQSIDEREKEGKRKGYAGLLEADLWRQEARSTPRMGEVGSNKVMENGINNSQKRLADDFEEGELAENKEQGMVRWRSKMEERFVKGEDADFEYDLVDGRDEFDDRVLEDREEEEKWFDQEEAAWADDTQERDSHLEQEGIGNQDLGGETGIQDF